jgi:DNA-binding MarR family transcriptional regulator
MDRKSVINRTGNKRRGNNRNPGWSPIHSPQAQLNYWLRIAGNRFAKAFDSELKDWRIIASEWAALRELYRPVRLSPLDVGRAIGMTKGGASKLIDRLVQKRLVKKEVGLHDRRFRTIELTKAGKDLVTFLAFSEYAVDRGFFGWLPPDERRQLMTALKRTLGAEHNRYFDQWITPAGGGQWFFQAAWRTSVLSKPLLRATPGRSQQSLQLFARQLAESSARQMAIEREGPQVGAQHPAH